ncbi:LamG-like jellyroll fold domain-containing protein [Aquimarina sp. AU474]|uniref:LamG-like jellyroll fold domain-containing protein n=1 Tax=Aquimarina sp. AU474 TaxID=2108529 RepID=UPI000D698B0A|nr:LamG-like jellyroll fold domain-containing protein [Aquimarina sp. AU474]
MLSPKSTISFLFICTSLIISLSSCQNDTTKEDLKTALTFYTSFDKGVDADFALGDQRLYTVPNRKARDSAQIGLHKPDIRIAKNEGLYGDGLLFTERSKGNIYYPSKDNIAYSKTDWSGAISFWLKLDPATDLEPGYCDPIQITDVSYNDAAIWVDFTKENPRDFRLGVIGDRNVWNPNPEGPDNENPIFNKRLTGVKNPPFSKEEWTHILINFSNLNTENGKASLYMNGELKGTRSTITTPFTWDLDASNIYIGLGYIGLLDELSIFNRSLTNKEISTIYALENGVHSLL